jgi:hypothetical protein
VGKPPTSLGQGFPIKKTTNFNKNQVLKYYTT